MKNTLWFIILSLFLLVIDQLTKLLFLNVYVDFGFMALNYVENTGISFGLFQGSSLIIIFVSFIVLGLLYYYRKEFKKKEVFLVLIVSGILGNLIDRIFLGYVRDFIDFKWWPVFNVADSLMFIGVFGIIIMVVVEYIKSIKKSKPHTK